MQAGIKLVGNAILKIVVVPTKSAVFLFKFYRVRQNKTLFVCQKTLNKKQKTEYKQFIM